MSYPLARPPLCWACAAVLAPPGHVCGRCRAAQWAPAPQQTVIVGPTRSAGVAVLLSILWLGAGHLYANRITAGVLLMIYDLFLVFLMIVPFGWIVAIPVWMISVVIVAVLAASAAGRPDRYDQVVVTQRPY